MSSPRKAARLELTPDMDVFATKTEPPSPPAQRAEPRSAAVSPPREKPPAAKVRPPPPSRGVPTTIAIPEPVMERIHVWLQKDQRHNMRSMVLYALTQIGIDVEPEHLKPTRRRWSR